MSEAKIGSLAPWFGANRMLAAEVGKLFTGCEWVGVVFAGSLAEVKHIKSRAIVVNDLHRHIINLALCIQCPDRRAALVEKLHDAPFHPDALEVARIGCRSRENERNFDACRCTGGVDWAYDYFVSSWMNRSALAGTDGEFRGGLPIRWSATGGDSNTRYRSAIQSLSEWGTIMERCNFSTLDWREFVAKCQDKKKHGIYCDPPFPGPGEKYKHKMTEDDHRDMATTLAGFKETLIVCRFYDHPLVRELYPEDRWDWRHLKGRDSCNNAEKPEVLLVNRR